MGLNMCSHDATLREGRRLRSGWLHSASVLAANLRMNLLLGKREMAVAPHYTFLDLIDQQFVVGTVEPLAG
jgi:hypothetical protein